MIELVINVTMIVIVFFFFQSYSGFNLLGGVSINFNMRRMDNRGDFIQRLGLDVSINILNLLDDPSDLVRACAVSHSWSRFGKLIVLKESS